MADTPYVPPRVQNRAAKPPGILPRHAQTWVIAGIAVVMVIVISLSGGKAPKERPLTPPPAAVDPNDERIQEYRLRIEQQAQKLALEQARLARATESTARPVAGGFGTPSAAEGHSEQASGAQRVTGYPPSTGDPEDHWIARDWEKRQHQGRFASNVALSHRSERPAQRPSESDVHRGAADETSAALPASSKGGSELKTASGKQYRIFEGTVLETVLTNRLDGSFSGPINCLVTTNLYSHDRSKLLIPQGARVLGTVSRVEAAGQQRLAVAFHRLIMPDGYSVSLDKTPGLSQMGETGLLDQVNHHYLQVFGVSLAIGAIAGLSQANTQYGSNASGADVYRQGVATSLSQSSLNILDRYLNVLPTFTIREGHRIKVYLTGDLLLPAYDNHRLPSDL